MLITVNYLVKENKEVEAPPEVEKYIELLSKYNKHTITAEERKEWYTLMDKEVMRDFVETFSPYQVLNFTDGKTIIHWEDEY